MQYPIHLRRRTLILWGASVTAPVLLAACGGVGEGGTGSSPQVIAIGPLSSEGRSSAMLNGIEFDLSSARVLDGFEQPLSDDALRLGVWVEISGTVNEFDGTGIAHTLRVRPAARGRITALDASQATIEVLGTEVRVEPGAAVVLGRLLGELSVGDVLETHGLLDLRTDSISATRIEVLPARIGSQPSFELRGRLSQVDLATRTARVGAQLVDFGNAAISLRSAPTDRQIVRVRSRIEPLQGQPWAVERIALDQVMPANAPFVYLEGLVSGLATGPRFFFEGVEVDASTANNRGLITSDGVRLAVVGRLDDGVLIARSVARAQAGEAPNFLLNGTVTAFTSIGNFRVKGVRVDASAAVFSPTTATLSLGVGSMVRIRGSFEGQTLVARRVEVTL